MTSFPTGSPTFPRNTGLSEDYEPPRKTCLAAAQTTLASTPPHHATRIPPSTLGGVADGAATRWGAGKQVMLEFAISADSKHLG